jgi:hypothetical protein
MILECGGDSVDVGLSVSWEAGEETGGKFCGLTTLSVLSASSCASSNTLLQADPGDVGTCNCINGDDKKKKQAHNILRYFKIANG